MLCGVLIGALAALALFKLARFARCGYGWRHHRHHRHHRGYGRGGGWLRWLFADLETTPTQRKNIEESVAALGEHIAETKNAFLESLADLAKAFESDDFDHEKVGEAWVKQDKALESIRLAAIEELGKIHHTLDSIQRSRLADLIRRRF